MDSSHSSLPSNETDENEVDFATMGRRKSLLFLYEAQRLANERRASLARAVTTDESTSKDTDRRASLVRAATIGESTPKLKEHRTFNFDQRSEETSDVANLDELNESPLTGQYHSFQVFLIEMFVFLELATPRSPVQRSTPPSDRSRTTISLPFIYLNTREQMKFPHTTDRSIAPKALVAKVIEKNDVTTQTVSSPELNCPIRQQEVHPRPLRPLLYSQPAINRKIEFHKFQPLSTQTTTMTTNRPVPIQITVMYYVIKNETLNYEKEVDIVE